MDNVSENYFVNILYAYFHDYLGNTMSRQFIDALSLDLSRATEEEKAFIAGNIEPNRAAIMNALASQMQAINASPAYWWPFLSQYPNATATLMAREILQGAMTPRPNYPQGAGQGDEKSSRIRAAIGILSVVLACVLIGGGICLYLVLSEPQRRLSHARDVYAQGDYAQTMDLCSEIVDKWPDKPQADEAESLGLDASLHYAETLTAEGGEENFKQAETLLDGLVASGYSDPETVKSDQVKLYLTWAMNYKVTFFFKEAVDQYEKAAALQPLGPDDAFSKVECCFQLGEQSKGVGKYGDAANAYLKCNSEDQDGPLAEAAWTNYIDMTVAYHIEVPPPSKEAAASGQAKIILINQVDEDFVFYVSGPTTGSYSVPAGQEVTIYVTPGHYNTIALVSNRWWRFGAADVDYTDPTSSGWYYTYTVYR